MNALLFSHARLKDPLELSSLPPEDNIIMFPSGARRVLVISQSCPYYYSIIIDEHRM
jgi:hypothetical protein